MSDEVQDAPAAAPSHQAVPVDAIVERYIKLRDKKAEMKKAYDESVAAIDAAMERCEAILQRVMNDTGTDSLKTKFGTAYQTIRTSATVADWTGSVLPWIREHGHWDMLDKRVNKSFVEAYRTEHNDLPPGVNWREDRVVNIRKS